MILLLIVTGLAGCAEERPDCEADACDSTGTETTSSTSSTSSSTSSSSSTSTSTTSTSAPAKRDPVTWDISIEGNDFVAGSITVQVGDSVRWTHKDGTTPHTVTADDGEFDSGACPGASCMTEATNDEYTFEFTSVGEFGYYCRVHPSMQDTITVVERHDATP